MNAMEKKQTSFRIDSETLKNLKFLALEQDKSLNDIILEAIEKEVPTHPLTHLLTLSERDLEIVEVRITPESTTIGKSVKEIPLPEESKLALVIPIDRKPHIPTPGTVLHEGDHIIALTTPELEAKLRTVLTGI